MPEAIRHAVLPNGLRICGVEMPNVRHVSIRLIVAAGSRDDPREKAGISAFWGVQPVTVTGLLVSGSMSVDSCGDPTPGTFGYHAEGFCAAGSAVSTP